MTIKGVTLRACACEADAAALFAAGNGARHVGATKMNAESSRSHLLFALQLAVHSRTTKKTAYGKLTLIDLAGSERVGKTGATEERLREAQSINKSLSALGNVIAALSSGAAWVPYRDHKLTQLLQDSLGGNAKTLMFVNVSPSGYNLDETTVREGGGGGGGGGGGEGGREERGKKMGDEGGAEHPPHAAPLPPRGSEAAA